MILKSRKTIIQLLISVVLLGALLYIVDVNETASTLTGTNPYYLVLALIIASLNRILMPVKWSLLLRVKDIHMSWWDLIRTYYISNFFGLFLPPTVGADIFRAYYVSRRGHLLRDVVSSILVERLLGMIAILLFGLVGTTLLLIMFTSVELRFDMVLSLIVVATILTVGGFFVSFSVPASNAIVRLLSSVENRTYIGRVARTAMNFYESYSLYRRQRGALFAFFLLTCLEVCLPILQSYVVGLSLGLSVSLLYFFAFVPIVVILSRLPISLNGFGIYEAAFVYFLRFADVSTSVGFSVGIVIHLVSLIAILPGGIMYALDRERKKVMAAADSSSRRVT